GQPVGARHAQIDEDHVGPRLVAERERARCITGLADHLDVQLLEEEDELVARERLVVDDQGSKLFHAALSISWPCSTGRRTVARIRRSLGLSSRLACSPYCRDSRRRSVSRAIPFPLSIGGRRRPLASSSTSMRSDEPSSRARSVTRPVPSRRASPCLMAFS